MSFYPNTMTLRYLSNAFSNALLFSFYKGPKAFNEIKRITMNLEDKPKIGFGIIIFLQPGLENFEHYFASM